MAPTPPSVFLLLHGLRFPVESVTEAGLTIGAEALGAAQLPDLGRRAALPGVLEVREGDAQDHYAVVVRLAGARAGAVDLAFAELSPDLRGRLRSLAAAADPSEQEFLHGLAFARAAEAPESGGRRLILPGSAAVWAVTSARRSGLGAGQPGPVPPLTARPSSPPPEAPAPFQDRLRLLVLALLALAALAWVFTLATGP